VGNLQVPSRRCWLKKQSDYRGASINPQASGGHLLWKPTVHQSTPIQTKCEAHYEDDFCATPCRNVPHNSELEMVCPFAWFPGSVWNCLGILPGKTYKYNLAALPPLFSSQYRI
jgi:hypothetical protein